jgi:hypothetical protein
MDAGSLAADLPSPAVATHLMRNTLRQLYRCDACGVQSVGGGGRLVWPSCSIMLFILSEGRIKMMIDQLTVHQGRQVM